MPSLCRHATAPPQSDRTPSPSIAGPPYPFLPPPSQVRIWDNLIPAAQSGALSTLLTTVLNIDWSRFDALKAFVLGYVRRYETQDARKIEQNRMVLELLRLLHQLLAAGFLKAAEVAPVLPRLLALLDGREVRMPGWHAGALATLVRRSALFTFPLDAQFYFHCHTTRSPLFTHPHDAQTHSHPQPSEHAHTRRK